VGGLGEEQHLKKLPVATHLLNFWSTLQAERGRDGRENYSFKD